MIEVRTPSRIHFGLLAYHPQRGRQFGGVGLMLRRPDVAIRVTTNPASGDFEGSGRMADRAVGFARRFAQSALADRLTAHVPPARIEVRRVPRPHTGLGSGTQLGMAVARAMAGLIERDDLGADAFSRLVGRGRRSAVGVHGSFLGGLIVDGGKGQLGIAQAVLQEFELSRVISIAALAKENEDLFVPKQSNPVTLPKRSPGLLLAQRIRDEAHRFALTHHRQRRGKLSVRSQLDSVPGIGPVRRKALLRHFGSLDRIRTATLSELLQANGMTRPAAQSLKEVL